MLLAVKQALKERPYCLEEADLPFLVWTGDKKLEHISSAKRLNSSQARWSLFFIRFNFTLSYCRGSRNIKTDALSWQFVGDEDPVEGPETIFPPPCVVASLTWDVEEKVQAATTGQPGPSSYKCVN